MDEVNKVMEKYFKTVTPEQFEKDLKEAGIENCPDMNCMYYYETRSGCILGRCFKEAFEM